jgi:hypothetical protein
MLAACEEIGSARTESRGTGSSNPVPSSGESANFRFRKRATAQLRAHHSACSGRCRAGGGWGRHEQISSDAFIRGASQSARQTKSGPPAVRTSPRRGASAGRGATICRAPVSPDRVGALRPRHDRGRDRVGALLFCKGGREAPLERVEQDGPPRGPNQMPGGPI